MIKRFVPLFMAAIVLVLSLAVPSYAAESALEDMFFDVLSYGFPNGGSSVNIYGTGEASCYFKIPTVKPVRYIDMVVQVGGGGSGLTAQVGGPSVKNDLTCEQISGNLYRVYGFTYYSAEKFYVYFQATSLTYITFKSVRVSFDSLDAFMIEGYCGISAYEYANTIHYIPTDTINYRRFTATDVDQANWFALFIYNPDWQKYDYIDVTMSLSVSSINTVTCTIGEQIVPMEVSYLSSASPWIISDYHITIRLDLRYLDRTSTDYPQIIIEGMLAPGESNFVGVSNMCGYVVSPSGNFLAILFRDLSSKLQGWFGSLIQALDGNTSSGDAFKDDTNDLIGDLGDITADMDSVTRPVMSDIDADFTADITDTTVLLGSLFSEVNKIQWLARLVLASVTMGLIAYILYGKE